MKIHRCILVYDEQEEKKAKEKEQEECEQLKKISMLKK
jgi:hypothetical protein